MIRDNEYNNLSPLLLLPETVPYITMGTIWNIKLIIILVFNPLSSICTSPLIQFILLSPPTPTDVASFIIYIVINDERHRQQCVVR